VVPRLTMAMRRIGHGERRRGRCWESHAEHLPEVEPKTEIASTELTMVQDGAIEIQAEWKILCAAIMDKACQHLGIRIFKIREE